MIKENAKRCVLLVSALGSRMVEIFCNPRESMNWLRYLIDFYAPETSEIVEFQVLHSKPTARRVRKGINFTTEMTSGKV